MLEMPSPASSALALPGVALAAAPAPAGAEGAVAADFSAVLAEMSLEQGVMTAPALTTVSPEIAAILPGKTGIAGNATGKTLPPGLPGEGETMQDEAEELTDAEIAMSAIPLPIVAASLPTAAQPAIASAPATARTVAAQATAHGAGKTTEAGPLQPAGTSQTASAQAEAPAPARAEAASTQPTVAAEHQPATAPQLASVDAPAPARQETAMSFAPVENRTIAPAPAPASSAPAAPTQDLATLVDRIVEARAAAAPEVVRAALLHDEFGSVSLRFRADDSHIQVTLGSADPGFAPAVHAAAAAAQANANADPHSDRHSDRREQASQQSASAQTTQDAQNTASGQQQQQQTTRDRAERGAAREAIFGQPAMLANEREQSASQPLRRSGIYA